MDHCFLAAELNMVMVQGTVFHVQRYPAAQEAQKYTEDATADRFFWWLTQDAAVQFKRSVQLLGNLTFKEACQHTILDFRDDVPNFATLANAALVIPVSSVSCERGFSLQKRVKPYQHSQLLDCSVDNELMLSMKATDYAVLTMKWRSVDNEMTQCWQLNAAAHEGTRLCSVNKDMMLFMKAPDYAVLTKTWCCSWRHQTMQC